jgi:3-dehydroquinate synthase
MSVLERTIRVEWRLRVRFTDGLFDAANPTFRESLPGGPGGAAKVLVIVEEALALARPGLCAEIHAYAEAHARAFRLVCPPVVVPGGESVKNAYFRVSEVHALIDRHHVDRHGYVVAVGGGALLDMVGLAAATAHRGVRHVRVPTTTLSQDDSGVGVKNGINAFGKKNFVGTFAPPFAVLNDFTLLETLPERDKRAGYVEAVKVACIRDAAFFGWIEENVVPLARFDAGPMRHLIRRSAELHLEHIATSGDPFEMGSARPLDFGHWSAHKLEQVSEYRIRHGEAVAVGIALDTIYARRRGYLDEGSACRVLGVLRGLGFGLFCPELALRDDAGRLVVLAGMDEFREHLGGRLTLTLLRGIGAGFEVNEMDLGEVEAAVEELRAGADA